MSDLQVQIDQKIEELEAFSPPPIEAILKLKAKRNALAPLCRLPTEIITMILLFAAPKIYPLGEKYTPHPRYYVHIMLSRICRLWRSVAINYAPLWSTIIFPRPRPEWVVELIQRSKGCPLSVYMTLVEENLLSEAAREALSLIQAEVHRIAVLNIVWEGEESDAMDLHVLPMLWRPAPLLQELSLNALDLDNNTPLFNCPLPNLKRLTLVGDSANINWGHPLLHSHPQLTHLRLIETPWPTFQQFLNVLQSMPNLQNLWLKLALPELDAQTGPPVPLTSLRKLTLSDSAPEAAAFLACIKLNPDVSLDLNMDCVQEDDHQSLIPFFRSLGRGPNNRQEMSIHSLYICAGEDNILHVAGDTVTTSNQYIRNGFKCNFMINSVHKDIIRDLLSALPLERLRALRSPFPHLPAEEWRKSLGGLKELESIIFVDSLDCDTSIDFIQSLDVILNADQEPPTVPLTNLKALRFGTPVSLQHFDYLSQCMGRRRGLGYASVHFGVPVVPGAGVPHGWTRSS